jgi:hypothetical protein
MRRLKGKQGLDIGEGIKTPYRAFQGFIATILLHVVSGKGFKNAPFTRSEGGLCLHHNRKETAHVAIYTGRILLLQV